MNYQSLLRRMLIMTVLILLPAVAWAAGPADADVPLDANDIKPLLVGQSIPDVTVKTIEGKPVSLRKLVARQPTLLIFYRGSWCPYCNVHLGEIAKLEPELLKMGIQILAISPDRPEYLQAAIEKNSLKYTLLSDSEVAAAKALGLAFKLDQDTAKKYKEYGIDLEKNSGHSHSILPVPAAFLITPEGKVSFAFVAPDYTVRVDSEVLLAAAKQMTEPKK